MKVLIFSLTLLLIATSCEKRPLGRFQPYNTDLDILFHSGTIKNWSNRKYKPAEVFDTSSPSYLKLISAGILNKNSEVIFSSPDCVSIVNRKLHAKLYIEQKDFSDTIIMYNGNEGKFACGINDIYSMNQDESIGNLHISVFKIDGAINVFIVNN
ncbi:MAG: hypothetical protein IM584_01020 [Chitinophagaceae bacterium]|nr:hypothetical protein [Chitinophagaceae bacterium]MCA6453654.1 hypothetical protein [Chitinophagaceae bacterium]MCA6454693.1 hypothetical protein [Chitinophagaceae bacterium]MCA6458052.1 hypothetical protein [Chitinophagaceae bacterium]MCA6463765.1 hypothetical protein [Chitinophagaceae bacterium]